MSVEGEVFGLVYIKLSRKSSVGVRRRIMSWDEGKSLHDQLVLL